MASKSLQEQLLGVGLVDKKKAKKIKAEKLQHKQKIKTGKLSPDDDSARRAELKLQKEEKVEKDRVLNLERQRVAEQKAIEGQIRQMILQNRIARADGDIAYNFTDNKKIKQLYVNQSLHNDLSLGRLAIVKLDDKYELVAEGVAAKISERNDSYIIVCNTRSNKEVEGDDPYADFKIPDDLMW